MAMGVGRLVVGLFVLAAVFGALERLVPAVLSQPRWRPRQR
jgi:hypothetical protein